MNHSLLTEAIWKSCKGKTPERTKNFKNITKTFTNINDCFWIPIRNIGNGEHAYYTVEIKKQTLIIMFTEECKICKNRRKYFNG